MLRLPCAWSADERGDDEDHHDQHDAKDHALASKSPTLMGVPCPSRMISVHPPGDQFRFGPELTLVPAHVGRALRLPSGCVRSPDPSPACQRALGIWRREIGPVFAFRLAATRSADRHLSNIDAREAASSTGTVEPGHSSTLSESQGVLAVLGLLSFEAFQDSAGLVLCCAEQTRDTAPVCHGLTRHGDVPWRGCSRTEKRP